MVSLNGKPSMVTEQLRADQRRRLLAEIPVGRFCEPAELAHLVRCLIAPPSGFIASEIVEDLEAALEQFREIATDLGGEVTEEVT